MSGFTTHLSIEQLTDEVFALTQPLIYESDLLGCTITVPSGFITDFASVPRVPIAYWFWGGRCHREAILHDYLYRIDSKPVVSFMDANRLFLEAMRERGKSLFVRYPMFWGVVAGGYFSYHKRKVMDGIDKFEKEN